MLSSEWLSTVVQLGVLSSPDRWTATGAGIFVNNEPVLWLVTARHLVQPDLVAMLTRDVGGRAFFPLQVMLEDFDLEWVEDESRDLAALVVPVLPKARMKAIDRTNMLDVEDLVPSMPAYAIGCPYGIDGLDPSTATPLVMDGIIAGKDDASGRIFTTAATYPGNSGGPLIVIRSPINPAGGLEVGRPTVFLAGVILSFATAIQPAERDDAPPLHLGVAQTCRDILGLLESSKAREMEEKARRWIKEESGAQE